jgi:hypothetical protein
MSFDILRIMSLPNDGGPNHAVLPFRRDFFMTVVRSFCLRRMTGEKRCN